jgi:hypothetical protein
LKTRTNVLFFSKLDKQHPRSEDEDEGEDEY